MEHEHDVLLQHEHAGEEVVALQAQLLAQKAAKETKAAERAALLAA